jgi:Tol biopolymer transport system component
MAWQPGTSLIFFYSDGISDEYRGYTFILNSDTGKVCELKLGGWASKAHWSSDGRYLAFIRSINYIFPTYSADLSVLDAVTGNLKVLSVIPRDTKGIPLVHDFVWAPDNRHLLAVGNTFPAPNSQVDLKGLYLVDLVSGQSVNILPEYNNSFSTELAWSPSGSKLLIRCPTNIVDRICFISVHNVQ